MSRNVVLRNMVVLGLVMLPLAVAGCATPKAADVNGRWRPVNRFAEAPQAIPLQQAYTYQASPADGTLRTMLGRWAKDARLTLAYLHPNDYTLHAPVAHIRTNSLEDAATSLSAAYAEQGVQVVIERPRIIVSQAVPPPADVAPAAALGD
ncbi:TcpQ domain-containing protein [Pseudoxanthomonas sp. LjRoot143]